MWIAVGAAVGAAWFLALLLLPVDWLPILNGSIFIVMGTAVLALGILIGTGVVSGVSRSPWPVAALAAAASLMLIYRGAVLLREGWKER